MHYHFRRSVSHSFAVFYVLDAHSGENAGDPIVAHAYFMRGCAPVPEKSSPAVRRVKEATFQRESGIHEPQGHQEEVGNVRDDLDDVDVVVVGLG